VGERKMLPFKNNPIKKKGGGEKSIGEWRKMKDW